MAVYETQSLRKLSVADTLAQATNALEAHRVWMKKRISTAVSPAESPLEGNPGPTPGIKHALEDQSTPENTESIDLESGPVSKLASAPPPGNASTREWLELLKQRKKSKFALNKIAPVAEMSSSDGFESPYPHHSFETLHDEWNSTRNLGKPSSQTDHEEAFIHSRVDKSSDKVQAAIQMTAEPTKEKSKQKHYSKASVVPSDDVPNSSTQSKTLFSTSDVFISPQPDQTLPVVTMNAWGSVSALDKHTEAGVLQLSEADGKCLEKLTPEFSTSEDDLFQQDQVTSHATVDSYSQEASDSSTLPDNSFASNSEHLQSLKAASTGRIIPVSPAPKDQRSSYDLQKQSKLSAADAAAEILDIKIAEMTKTNSELRGIRVSSAKQSVTADIKDMPEAMLQSVLPNTKGARTSVLLSQPVSQRYEGADAHQKEVDFKDESIQKSRSLSESQGNPDTSSSVVNSSEPGRKQNLRNLDLSQTVFKEESASIPSPNEVTVESSDAPKTQGNRTSKTNTADHYRLQSRLPHSKEMYRNEVLKELDLPPLKPLQLEEVIDGSELVRKLPPLKVQSPHSPFLADLSFGRKRQREPPSYSIHQSQRGDVLAPPCPAFGIEQPTETEVLRSLSKKQAPPTTDSTPTKITTARPTSATSLLAHPLARFKNTTQKSLPEKDSESSSAATVSRAGTAADGEDGSFRMQSTLVAQNLQASEQMEEINFEDEDEKTPSTNQNQRPLDPLQTGSMQDADVSVAADSISVCEMSPGPGPLHMAAKSGNLRRVQTLLRQGHNVDMPDQEGRTPLMFCIHSLGVHLSCADALIKEGANLNKQSSDGSTAMHLAASVGAVSLIELMILNGASAKIRDFDGRLPLHWATTPRTTKSIALLIKYYSVDINTTDDAGMTPLMWATYNSSLTVTAYLLEQGADCEEKDKDGYTAMHWAIHKDSTLCLQLLLMPDMTYFKDSRGRTVMHMAAEVGAMAACDVILKLRPDALHDTDKKDRTPLHYAAACSRVDVCALLLDRGADATQKDSSQKTPLDYARSKKLDYVVALLTCHGTAVADFARASRSTSVSSFLSHAVSFTQLVGDNTTSSAEDPSETLLSTSHRSLSSMLSGGRNNRVGPVEGEREGDATSVLSGSIIPATLSLSLSHTSEILGEDISLYGDLDGDENFNGLITNGGLLGRFTTDRRDPVQHFYFWLKPKTNSLCWAREHQRKFAKEAKILEIHEGPSNTVKQSPIYSPSDLHKYVFWVTSAVGVLDLFAYNQEAYLTWIKAISKLAQRNSKDEIDLKQNRSKSRPASSYTLKSNNSVAPMNTSRPNSPDPTQKTPAISNDGSEAIAGRASSSSSSSTAGDHEIRRRRTGVQLFLTSTPIPPQSTAESAVHVSAVGVDDSSNELSRIPQVPVQFLDDVI